jgi:mannose-6-phosphate isomerase-like protein (cupin superfamily)
VVEMSKLKDIIPEYHPKGWGYELWFHNTTEYCGKLLFFKEGKRCSLHYHEKKRETFYLQSGKMLVRYGDSIESLQEILMTSGNKFEVDRGLLHQMIALEDSELFEFSTEHFEGDSYRVAPGDRIKGRHFYPILDK